MKSESGKTFDHGFAIGEQELRRIHDLICQQMKASVGDGNFESSFELKFKNGVISNPSSLDEILSQENIGSSSIERLNITVFKTDDINNTKIFIQFMNTNQDGADSDDSPIKYKVVGNDRDWVFITSSQLDERIGRVKIFSITKSFDTSLFTFFLMAGFLAVALFFMVPKEKASLENLNSLEAQWKNHQISDIAEIVFAIERQRLESQNVSSVFQLILTPMIALGVIFTLFAIYGIQIIHYLFPPYNFLWGDYVKMYEKRKSTSNFIFVVIILGIVLSVSASYIYSYLTGH